MNKATVKQVLANAQRVAQQAAEVCKDGSNEINNQLTISTLMLATCIMGRFFNEDKDLMRGLLEVMLAAIDEMPCAEEFDNLNIH